MNRVVLLVLVSLVGMIAVGVASPVTRHSAEAGGAYPFEVWAIDQSDSTADGGGTLSIYQDDDLTASGTDAPRAEVIDLGGAARALCLEQTGSAPRRPHMFYFNAAHSHVVLAFVATGHVLFMEAASRRPVACIDVGEQAHAAVPTPDQRSVIVANQNGKLLQRIRTNYVTNSFTLEDAATLDLATCRTPAGAPCQDLVLRPDNAPICPAVDAASRWVFVTLRGGGLFVVDLLTTPMAIVAEYDRAVLAPNGCGGLETMGTMYINSGGGTPGTPFRSDVYAFDLRGFPPAGQEMNTPAPRVLFRETGRVDSHGGVLLPGGMLWMGDRAANKVVVLDAIYQRVSGSFDLTGPLSSDPAPDLMDIAPTGDWVFITLRGPSPLTGNAPEANNAVGATPGVAVVRVMDGGTRGALVRIARISRIVDGAERADPHGIGVRRK